MALNILTAYVGEAVRYEPTPPAKPNEAIDGAGLNTLAHLASYPLQEKLFFRRVFFGPPDALS
jgi:hypothetical protein